MGFKPIDIVPIASNGPTPISPVPKDVQCKAFQVLRTDTTATTKMMLPGDSTIIDIHIAGVASDAATTAVVSIGSSVTATEYINAQDVKTAGGMIRPTSTFSTNLPNLENVPITKDILIWAKYAETGTASTVGGPYTVFVYHVR